MYRGYPWIFFVLFFAAEAFLLWWGLRFRVARRFWLAPLGVLIMIGAFATRHPIFFFAGLAVLALNSQSRSWPTREEREAMPRRQWRRRI
ncbi:MAG: hypothetical protein ACRDOI_06025 [Trebonia sp.]